MASCKIFIRKSKKDQDGKCPMAICVTINRKTKTRSLGIKLKEEEWDEKRQVVTKASPNERTLNKFLSNAKLSIENRILELEMRNQVLTHDAIFNPSELNTSRFDGDFIQFAEAAIEDKNTKCSYNTRRGWRSKLNTLKSFSKRVNLHTADYNFLERYQGYLLKEVEGITEYSTVHTHLKFIRRFWNLAIKKGLTNNYPFKNFTMVEPVYADKCFLEKNERDKLIQLLRSGELPAYLEKTLHFFLIACYSGLRYSDWRQCKNVKNDVLVIKEQKKDAKDLLIPISAPLKRLIDSLPSYWYPFSNQRCNRYLKELKKLANIEHNITTHTARHTFAMMCLNEAEMDFEMVASLIGDEVTTVKRHYARYHIASKKKAVLKLNDL